MGEAKYELNQRVWIYRYYRHSSDGPEEGRVTKVGRTLVTVASGHNGYRTEQFRMDTGRLNDKSYGSGTYIQTDEEKLEAERRSAVLQKLLDQGIRFELRSAQSMHRLYSVETLERLAAVIEESGELKS
jgi:hypothetical protein